MTTDEPALLVEAVRKTYGDTVAIDGVSLSVGRGEVFGLVGPNGAGKTTLVRALTGTTRVEGSVRTLGAPPRDVARDRVGLLPQSFDPPDRLTARELLRYYAGLYAEARDPESVLADVGLADDADVRYEHLSGGQRRRVCVGAALVNDPDALFLDEPTAGIDPAGRREIWALVEDLAAGGTTVFLTSHSMPEVERLADRVGILRDGRLVTTGSPPELVAAHGGGSRLLVHVADAVADLPELEYPVQTVDGDLAVEGVAPEDIGSVVDDLTSAGVTLESVTWTEPSLADVYLALTGETYEGARPGPGTRVGGEA